MKKKYIAPTIVAMKVKTMTIMAGSITSTNAEGLGYGGDTNGNVTEGNSRGGGFWDDED